MENDFKKYRITFCLIAVNVVIYLLNTVFDGALNREGTMSTIFVLGYKQYWRVLTACFLHGNFMHIFSNMVTLLFIGMFLEERVSRKLYLANYLLAGLGGNLVSLYYKYTNQIFAGTIGASGAIFGLDGFLLAKSLFPSKTMAGVHPVRVIVMIALSIGSGRSADRVDNAAHVGGLLTGFVVGMVDNYIKYRRNKNLVDDLWR